MPGRRLTDDEIEAYDVLPPQLARRVRVVRIPVIPGGYAGMTLGPLVLVAMDVEADGDSTLLAHELVHVRQWADRPVGFALRYLADFIRGLARHRNWQAAYRQIDAEVEARRDATDWNRRRLAERRRLDQADDDHDDHHNHDQ